MFFVLEYRYRLQWQTVPRSACTIKSSDDDNPLKILGMFFNWLFTLLCLLDRDGSLRSQERREAIFPAEYTVTRSVNGNSEGDMCDMLHTLLQTMMNLVTNRASYTALLLCLSPCQKELPALIFCKTACCRRHQIRASLFFKKMEYLVTASLCLFHLVCMRNS